ncbi:alpha/beta hydrolase [Lysobacter enzymogenes]|uniref:alpha/beta hydrolase n=1 Tax=Lysobacter enzymogenes TaxID=69 RepID=UPI000897CE7B|nr:alpha/beta fold hydrolase [Lysobacter enzymogenes]SDW64859.1 TAP-like protein [Lysobacter enzymogenes]
MRTSAWKQSLWLLLCCGVAFAAPAAAHRPGEIEVERGRVDGPSGPVDYEIGTLYVRENRARADSRVIGVGFARIKAPRATGAPPVFWLPGGPGLSVLGSFTDKSESAQSRLRSWLAFGEVGDLVVVEQRGYTLRGERLTAAYPASPLDRPASIDDDARSMRELARAAVAANPDKDLSGYSIVELADDVDELRRALGYERISLFGGSFGSQWSLAALQLFPHRVVRAVLSGVEPLDNGYDMPSHVFAALQRIGFEADRDPALAPYLPPGGMMGAVRALHQRFAAGPVRVRVRDAQGREQEVTLGAQDLQLALLAHTDEAGRWPAFILSLYHQHYQAWAREVAAQRAAGEIKLIGPLIDTGLGVSAAREYRLRSDPALDYLGAWNFESYIASARDWPTPGMKDSFRLPRRQEIPVLFVHGDWDTSTPVENTRELLPYFRNGRAIVVHRGGHDGAFYLLRDAPQAKKAVYEFLRSGRDEGLPAQVDAPLPKFEVPDFAPPPRG